MSNTLITALKDFRKATEQTRLVQSAYLKERYGEDVFEISRKNNERMAPYEEFLEDLGDHLKQNMGFQYTINKLCFDESKELSPYVLLSVSAERPLFYIKIEFDEDKHHLTIADSNGSRIQDMDKALGASWRSSCSSSPLSLLFLKDLNEEELQTSLKNFSDALSQTAFLKGALFYKEEHELKYAGSKAYKFCY